MPTGRRDLSKTWVIGFAPVEAPEAELAPGPVVGSRNGFQEYKTVIGSGSIAAYRDRSIARFRALRERSLYRREGMSVFGDSAGARGGPQRDAKPASLRWCPVLFLSGGNLARPDEMKLGTAMSLSVLHNFCSGSRFGWEYDNPPIARGSDPGGTLRRVAS